MSSITDLAVDAGCLSEHFGCLPCGLLFSSRVDWFLPSMVDPNGGRGEAARPLNPTFWNLNYTIFTPIL